MLIAWLVYLAVVINLWRWSRQWYDKSFFYFVLIIGGIVMLLLSVAVPVKTVYEDITADVKQGHVQIGRNHYIVTEFEGESKLYSYTVEPSKVEAEGLYNLKFRRAHVTTFFKTKGYGSPEVVNP